MFYRARKVDKCFFCEVAKHKVKTQLIWIQILVLPPNSYVILGKLPNISVLQFPHLWNEDNNSI